MICSVVVVLGWCKWLSEAAELLQVFERNRGAFFFLVPTLPAICFILLEGSGEET